MEDRIKTFMDWYTRPEVKFELIKFLRDREFACLVPSWCPKDMQKKSTRTLRCHSVQHLDIILFKILDVAYKKTLYNLYTSMAKYMNGLPYQNPNLAERDTKQWKGMHFVQMHEYDWLIDIDAGSHDDIDWAFKSTDQIKRLLDKCKIPYHLRFSGCGFHIIVPYRAFAFLNLHFRPWEDGNYFSLLTELSKQLNEKHSELVDYKMPDSRRVVKIPYSISFYKDAEYLCIPFTSSEDFYNFNLEKMQPDNWKGLIRGRDSIEFNRYEKPEFSKLMKSLEVDVNDWKKD